MREHGRKVVDFFAAQRSWSAQRLREASWTQQGNTAGGRQKPGELSAREAQHPADGIGRQVLVDEGLSNDGDLPLHAGNHLVAASACDA